MEYYTIGIEVGLVFKYSSALLSEVHEVTDIVIRGDHLDLGNRLLDMDVGSRFWEVFGIRYIEVCVDLSIGELTATSLPSDILFVSDTDESSYVS